MQTHTLNNQALRKLIALLGVDATETLLEEFGGTLFPEAAPSATPSVALRLECCLNPAMPIGHAAQALPDALDALRRAGVSAQVLRVEQRGLGDAYLNALERALSIPVTALAR